MFGRPVRLGVAETPVGVPRRLRCGGRSPEQGPRIAPERGLLTCRAARWSTEVVGRKGRAVSDAAEELGCDWHTVNKEVVRNGGGARQYKNASTIIDPQFEHVCNLDDT